MLRLRVRGRREPVAVVGTLPAVQPGEVLALAGGWQTDRVHGAQFRPQRVAVRPPAALEDVARYLGSGLIRQLGPVLARRIVDTFGERTLEVLDTQPERVREVPGIGPRRAAALAEAWVEHRALRAVAAFLAEHGLGTALRPAPGGRLRARTPRPCCGPIPTAWWPTSPGWASRRPTGWARPRRAPYLPRPPAGGGAGRAAAGGRGGAHPARPSDAGGPLPTALAAEPEAGAGSAGDGDASGLVRPARTRR